MGKRIVFVHRTGLAAGLSRIVGLLDPTDEIAALPDFVDAVEIGDGRTVPASLVRVRSRYVEYREIVAPSEAGRFGETFHPRQA